MSGKGRSDPEQHADAELKTIRKERDSRMPALGEHRRPLKPLIARIRRCTDGRHCLFGGAFTEETEEFHPLAGFLWAGHLGRHRRLGPREGTRILCRRGRGCRVPNGGRASLISSRASMWVLAMFGFGTQQKGCGRQEFTAGIALRSRYACGNHHQMGRNADDKQM